MRLKNILRIIKIIISGNISSEVGRIINKRSTVLYTGKDCEYYLNHLTAYEAVISEKEVLRINNLLKEDGIFYVREVLPLPVLVKLKNEIELLFQDFDSSDGEKSGYIVQNKRIIFKSYKELVQSALPVVTIRSGRDNGMIDIFNFDRLLSRELQIQMFESLKDVSMFFERHFDMYLQNYNLYLNKGVDHTRGFHIDDMSHTLKAFLYLDDVLRFEDGPYVYCPGTHEDEELLKINSALSLCLEHKSDTPFLFNRAPLPIFGKQGSMIVSDQTGIHRGHPQAHDGSRKILVLRFIKK